MAEPVAEVRLAPFLTPNLWKTFQRCAAELSLLETPQGAQSET